MDFLLYLFEEEREERLYNQWVHTTMQQSFQDFKEAQGLQSVRNRKNSQPINKDEEKDLLNFASRIIRSTKPNPESGVD